MKSLPVDLVLVEGAFDGFARDFVAVDLAGAWGEEEESPVF